MQKIKFSLAKSVSFPPSPVTTLEIDEYATWFTDYQKAATEVGIVMDSFGTIKLGVPSVISRRPATYLDKGLVSVVLSPYTPPLETAGLTFDTVRVMLMELTQRLVQLKPEYDGLVAAQQQMHLEARAVYEAEQTRAAAEQARANALIAAEQALERERLITIQWGADGTAIHNLFDALVTLAEFPAGRVWQTYAKEITGIAREAKDGFMYTGQLVQQGALEIEKGGKVFLVVRVVGSTKHQTTHYRLVVMTRQGTLMRVPEVEENDLVRGWALRMRDTVQRLLDWVTGDTATLPRPIDQNAEALFTASPFTAIAASPQALQALFNQHRELLVALGFTTKQNAP